MLYMYNTYKVDEMSLATFTCSITARGLSYAPHRIINNTYVRQFRALNWIKASAPLTAVE